MHAERLLVCLAFLLEAGYSARTNAEHVLLLEQFAALRHLAIGTLVERRAIDAQRQLARVGHNRLPAVDVTIAALADVHGVGVLHYDGDYDLILDHTDLRYESRWLSPRGTL